MAMQVGLSGQVVAFEPDPVAFARLELHVRKNDLSNVVSILAAVSSSSDSVELISVGGLGSTLSHLRYPDEPVAQAEVTLEVKSVVPDALVASGRIRLPDLIKVDVQGHGASALRGSIESIRARHPVIIFSSHSPWELREARELLEPLGYGVQSLAGEPIPWERLGVETGILIAPSTPPATGSLPPHADRPDGILIS